MLLEQPTILILDAPPGEVPEADDRAEREALTKLGFRARWIAARGLDAAGLDRALRETDVILTWQRDVDATTLARAGRCLLIIHYGPGAGPGVAHVDLDAARAAGIYVASTPNTAPGEWADAALRLLRALIERTGGDPAASLAGRRLGIVGMGQVGREVARRAKALGMERWACDPFAMPHTFEICDARRADLETLTGIADVVTLHAPLGPTTRGMIGAAHLSLMKSGALLVNASAAELVDLDALAAGMARGRPAGAAFDEDLNRLLPSDHALLRDARVIHGPRRAGTSAEAGAACRCETGRVVADFLRGARPSHLMIDPPCPRQILLAAGERWT